MCETERNLSEFFRIFPLSYFYLNNDSKLHERPREKISLSVVYFPRATILRSYVGKVTLN